MPAWQTDPRWELVHFDPAHFAAPPTKPTIGAERSADGCWASAYHVEDGHQAVIVASWMLVGPSKQDLAAMRRQQDARVDRPVRTGPIKSIEERLT